MVGARGVGVLEACSLRAALTLYRVVSEAQHAHVVLTEGAEYPVSVEMEICCPPTRKSAVP